MTQSKRKKDKEAAGEPVTLIQEPRTANQFHGRNGEGAQSAIPHLLEMAAATHLMQRDGGPSTPEVQLLDFASFPYETRRGFTEVLDTCRFRISDFNASMKRSVLLESDETATLMFTVSRTSNGTSRNYHALEPVGWVVDFRKDLVAGAFGPPG